MRRAHRVTVGALGLALALHVSRARAQPAGGEPDASAPPRTSAEPEDPAVAEARALFERGAELADEQRYAEAAEAFERSFALVERASTLFNLALCHYALGRHVEAIAVLERYLDLPRAGPDEPDDPGGAAPEGLDEASRADAVRMLAHARRSVGTLALSVVPADARVSVDGRAVEGGANRSLEVNPGTHVVRAEAPHHDPVLLEVSVARGARVRRAVQLATNRSPARLAVDVPEHPEARILVDGEPAGRGRARLSLDAGTHRVRVEAPDRLPLERALALDWNERASLSVAALRERPAPSLAEQPLFWAMAGGAALAVGAALAIGFAAAEAGAPSGGSTGVVLGAAPGGVEIAP